VRPGAVSPERLALARKLRGLTQKELAKKIGVTQAAVSQFESGGAVPSAQTTQAISMSLKVAPTFLTRGLDVRYRSRPFFRALARTAVRERDRAEAYALVVAELVEVLDRYVEMPPIGVDLILRADETTTDDAIELAARRARSAWGIGTEPVPDVINLAEARGVVVVAVGDFDEAVDAFSIRTSKRPVVVLCTGKGVAARRRFDMAHELGHLALHENRLRDQRRQEEQAHRFASAFLMPAGEVEPWLPKSSRDLSALEDASRTWGVSMQAALYRAKQLGIMAPDEFARGMRRLSAAGWRTREPVEIGPPERPTLLQRAIATLPAAGTSLDEIAEGFGVPVGRLTRMLALPETHDGAQHNVVDIRASRRSRK
jgi:Zn-dependent peptidase ImmA (M78 family)/transcriptional regulator with XRE-family HTH domain